MSILYTAIKKLVVLRHDVVLGVFEEMVIRIIINPVSNLYCWPVKC